MTVAYKNLTPGKQQIWLQEQSPPRTKEQAQEQKRVRRLVKLSRDEEAE